MTSTAVTTPGLDEARTQRFTERLLGMYTDALVVLMIDLADRTGLLPALAAAPGTSTELAARAGLQERYVRECLGALVTAGLVSFDPGRRQYLLPAEHAVCLTGATSRNLAPMARVGTLLAGHVPGVARAFREGGGVPYEAFRPEFTDMMDAVSRGLVDSQLIDGILPLAGDLVDRLAAGIRVADLGCGTGHAVNVMARAFPRSRFVGYDLAADAIDAAQAEAAEIALINATFEVLDVAALPADPPFDAVCAFDAIHDQADPAGVLARAHAALVPGGTFLMMDVKAASDLEDNLGNPFAPWLYGVSTLHCTTVSLARGGAGLGTVWGERVARQMLADAGFVDLAVHDVPDDPLDSLYVARKGAQP
ncbi:class I SAM-dependent methyltransferase [Actinomycetospora cinnamomea]|uniref:Methyltransferase family protein n=1 Tax=Actinomycetospora cinnamomea TaxID=663609 RepID=A0A2U1EYJ3_9PSEU|nr:methyltransferase domain-containing protein [Actinomycetospora cinnamomea]PVZ05003.1 methyltransferase family protein [Actinomycetospora cinnamomea]